MYHIRGEDQSGAIRMCYSLQREFLRVIIYNLAIIVIESGVYLGDQSFEVDIFFVFCKYSIRTNLNFS